jgi:molybdate transport system substrate-binding protein
MNSKYRAIFFVVVAVLMFSASAHGQEKLMVFCGAAFKQPMEEIIQAFTTKTKVEVQVTYGGVGTLLSQIMLTRRGDLFIVPSSYVMERAQSKGLLAPRPLGTFAYVVPAINVQKGNPKGITCLKDLTQPSVRVAIANPETVFVGMLAAELVEKALNSDEQRLFKKNVVTCPEDFNTLATALIFKKVDAIIGFHYLGSWYPDQIDTVKLKAVEIQRIGAGKVGVLSHSKSPLLAERFKHFLVAHEGQRIFAKYYYFATAQQAFAWIGAKKPVGGEYPAAADWYENR